ncbi:uncharacterized protein LOC131682856 isoform X5 [Topomyia yanbarensis]|uniref:uncharacterized protein LOC131682856 isoform X5 n=1 Tax=Topomyia yanbarensis TaxID=2498891 RepID=UPI00273B85DA|nr:uncharacterized protein LOC131682856 isoform X5 [Topomyia yanbarensis]
MSCVLNWNKQYRVPRNIDRHCRTFRISFIFLPRDLRNIDRHCRTFRIRFIFLPRKSLRPGRTLVDLLLLAFRGLGDDREQDQVQLTGYLDRVLPSVEIQLWRQLGRVTVACVSERWSGSGTLCTQSFRARLCTIEWGLHLV